MPNIEQIMAFYGAQCVLIDQAMSAAGLASYLPVGQRTEAYDGMLSVVTHVAEMSPTALKSAVVAYAVSGPHTFPPDILHALLNTGMYALDRYDPISRCLPEKLECWSRMANKIAFASNAEDMRHTYSELGRQVISEAIMSDPAHVAPKLVRAVARLTDERSKDALGAVIGSAFDNLNDFGFDALKTGAKLDLLSCRLYVCRSLKNPEMQVDTARRALDIVESDPAGVDFWKMNLTEDTVKRMMVSLLREASHSSQQPHSHQREGEKPTAIQLYPQ